MTKHLARPPLLPRSVSLPPPHLSSRVRARAFAFASRLPARLARAALLTSLLTAAAAVASPAERPARRKGTWPQGHADVLLVGASSIAFYLGAELEERLERAYGLTVARFGKVGSGLARPDVFDWPANLEALLAETRPKVVIGQFGGNDAQPFIGKKGNPLKFGTPEWEQEYAERVARMVSAALAWDATPVILGMPITLKAGFSKRLERINDITRRVTLSIGGYYVSTWELAADAWGRPRSHVSYKGTRGPMYLSDGVHYSRLGAEVVADELAVQLEPLLRLPRLSPSRRPLPFFSRPLPIFGMPRPPPQSRRDVYLRYLNPFTPEHERLLSEAHARADP